jgi:hypothetical protein
VCVVHTGRLACGCGARVDTMSRGRGGKRGGEGRLEAPPGTCVWVWGRPFSATMPALGLPVAPRPAWPLAPTRHAHLARVSGDGGGLPVAYGAEGPCTRTAMQRAGRGGWGAWMGLRLPPKPVRTRHARLMIPLACMRSLGPHPSSCPYRVLRDAQRVGEEAHQLVLALRGWARTSV